MKCLNRCKDARVQIPSDTKLQECAPSVKSQHPDFDDIQCTMDDMKNPIQSDLYTEIQIMFYNSWQSGNYATYVFVFAADGTIPICCFNLPGLTHDSTAADSGFMYVKLGRVYHKTGLKRPVDSASRCKESPYLLKSIHDDLYACGCGLDQREVLATYMHQATEWGMCAFQSMFPRVKDTIAYEENNESKIML